MSLLFQDRSRPHQFLTAILWTLSVVATLVAAAIGGLTAAMVMSLDWGETIAAGSEPWVNALVAGGEFVGIALASVLGMVLWHTRRFKVAALVLVFGAAVVTAWLGGRFILEYT